MTDLERRIALAIGDLQEAMRELNGYAPPPGADFINLKNSSMVKDYLPLIKPSTHDHTKDPDQQ